MPKSPKNKSNKDSDEPVTQFFNFPDAWVKDYDPQIHGFLPASHLQPKVVTNPPPPQQMPPGQYRQTDNAQTPSQKYQPDPNSFTQQPQGAQLTQSQWNPNGVYGGSPELNKKAFPWWGWLVIALLVLIILLIAGSLLRIYPIF